MELNLNINLKMEPETAKALDNIATVLTAGAIALGGKKEVFLQWIAGHNDQPEGDPGDLPEEISDPAPAPAPKPEPVAQVSDEDLINAVAETKKTVPSAAIRDLFKAYDIPCSTKCPPEKRPSLLSDLKKLRDAQ